MQFSASGCYIRLRSISRAEAFSPVFMPSTSPMLNSYTLIYNAGFAGLTFGAGQPAYVQSIVKVSEFEVPPPGAGFFTVTVAVPGLAISLARIFAVTWPLFTKVVERLAPFHWATQPKTKFEPVMVRVKFSPPCVALLGESEASDGTGLGWTNLNTVPKTVPPLLVVP